jgi:hypothetical protein
MIECACGLCVRLPGGTLMVGREDHTITDARGRRWTFEMHPYCGPIVLRQDGSPATNQPGERSAFWPAFEAWQQRRRAD